MIYLKLHPIPSYLVLPEAWTVKWWMGMYGAKTPKRHIAWCNTGSVGLLDLGKLQGWNYKPEEYKANRTATTVIKGGKKRFQGNKKQLKESQYLDTIDSM